MNNTLSRNAAVTLLLTAAGYAGNIYGYEVFYSIYFIFGSIFSLLALQSLGIGWGIASGFIVSVATYFLWNHPYAVIIMTLEAVVIAYLHKKRRAGLVLAAAIYWLFIGMPLVFVFYYGVMHLPMQNATVTMLKQAVNGIGNALIARLLFMVYASLKKVQKFTLREVIFTTLIMFTLIPCVTFIAVESQREKREIDSNIRKSLLLTQSRASKSVQKWLDSHFRAMNFLAEKAGEAKLPEMQMAVDDVHASTPDFLRVGLHNSNATTIAYSPLIDDSGKSNIGKNFADRPFIPILKANLKPMLSEVVMGRMSNPPQPIVSVLSPVTKDGAYNGYVIGVLNIVSLKELCEINLNSASLQGLKYSIIDKNGNIVITNLQNSKSMEKYFREEGDLKQLEEGISEWSPKSVRNVSVSNKWKKAVYIAETDIVGHSEWKLVLEVPVEPFQMQMYSKYTATLVRLMAAIVAALIVGVLLTRLVMRPMERLTAYSSSVPADLLAEEGPVIVESHLEEPALLQTNFTAMIQRLKDKFVEIRDINASLEQRVQERTKAVSELNIQLEKTVMDEKRSKELLESILDSAPIAISWAENGKAISFCNRRFIELIGYDYNDVPTLDQWFVKAYPDSVYRKAVVGKWEEMRLKAVENSMPSFGPIEAWILCKDGLRRCFDIYGSALTNAQLAIFSDVTDRKNYEEKLADYGETQKTLVREVNHRVKNNLAMIIGMLHLESDRLEDEKCREVLVDLDGRISALSKVHSMLSSVEWRPLALRELCTQIIAGNLLKSRSPRIDVTFSDVMVDSSQAHNIALVLNELVTNTAKHAFTAGDLVVSVSISKSEKMVELRYQDNGAGYPQQLLDEQTYGKGIGIQLVKGIAEGSLRGSVKFSNNNGAVTIVSFEGTSEGDETNAA